MQDRYLTPCYLDPHQARSQEPTAYENLLGDSIERAFGSDITELDALANFLNDQGPQPQTADTWTTDNLAEELKRLAND
ncbi:MAG TPA: hypothetical protein DEB15_10380 [Pusillimonas sp.]|jgi:hypothetical protein|nr:hypothetical protein [Pusillimonas sp.]MBC43850.1 hypothetical protein [Pusillimonas sp.]HBT33194.1 hypothetical protein [Pusillimonas sp.]HCN71794.1 hypothetical protein [Pusillimonas sp.]HCP78102.1 hypothetical protein [Pusillimonas sp.]|tara:strand:- start:77233 stop:77469 length:237 start_codon:yes stop_codon:yes gene_type:complete